MTFMLLLALSFIITPCQAAINFDGVNDYISIRQSPLLDLTTTNFSFSFWVNISGGTGNYRAILTNNNGLNTPSYEIGIATNDRVYFFQGGALVTTTSPIPHNAWYHITFLFNDATNTGTVYINGIFDGNITGLNNMVSTTSPFYIGVDGPTGVNEANFFQGSLDDVRIYNKLLTINEIQTLYNSRSKRPSGSLASGLVAHYEMNDNSIAEVAAQAKDNSGNFRHGQFIGFDNLVSNGFSMDVPALIGTGNSLRFDGFNDYIDTIDDGASNGIGPFHFDDAENWSIMLWYKGSDIATNFDWGKTVIGRDDGDIWGNLILRNGRVEYIHYNSSWQHNIISNNNVANNDWHFICYVNHSNATGDLFIDSNPDIVGASSTFDDPSRRFVVSSLMKGYNNRFTNGFIDDIRIYNKALTNSEISFLYNGSGLDPGTSNLQALWTFDDDSALKDSSGNNNHGVGVGGDSLKYGEGILRR